MKFLIALSLLIGLLAFGCVDLLKANPTANTKSEYCSQRATQEDKDYCFMELAETTKNAAVCENVNGSETMADYCYGRYAVAAKDIEGCKHIKNTFLKDGCVEDVSGTG